ncbi:MAG: hypothetical protein H6656_21110 [Ardenticatenaceae bacterium]|nr:hypothetical protein [Ardenticatenaceae bacterium]
MGGTMRPLLKKFTLLSLFLLMVPACQSEEAAPTPTSRAQVVIDITSGVPSPQWELAAAEVEELAQLLSALPPENPIALYDGLGYRGFVITMTSPQRVIRVQNGHVAVEQGGANQTFADTDQLLEKWLLSISKPHVEPQLYSTLEEAIEK